MDSSKKECAIALAMQCLLGKLLLNLAQYKSSQAPWECLLP